MKRPLVTVLMAMYNGGEYLKQTIRSVLDQTYGDFEFLIINDCSTDNSLEIIESFRDDRITVYNNTQNLGQTPSLNVGLKLAKGDYFARMDGDDIALPQWLEAQIDYMEKHSQYSVVSSYAVAIDEKNRIKKLYQPPVNREDIILRSLITSPIHHVGSIFKKKEIIENGGYDNRYVYAADYELWERLMRNGFEITTNPEILVAIREHGSSVSRSEHGRSDLEEIKEIAGKNILQFVNAQISENEISLFCRANYDEGNLTDTEFSAALEATKKIYRNLTPSLKVDDGRKKQWKRQRVMTIYLKRIFAVINQEDYSSVKHLSFDAMKEFGPLSLFIVFWGVSLFRGLVLSYIPKIYHKKLRSRACHQLGIPLSMGTLN